MTISVNNQVKELEEGTAVQTLLSSLGITTSGIAVAINNTVIPKSEWAISALKDDDTVVIIQATQGG